MDRAQAAAAAAEQTRAAAASAATLQAVTAAQEEQAALAAAITPTAEACDVLCSLAKPLPAYAKAAGSRPKVPKPVAAAAAAAPVTEMSLGDCPKQHQLPMFLSKTYHMIDRCDSSIATWSADGTNFVVKNVEQFASSVLPLYFKHSNFSSFARQLNFYGFRKLRTDPILTSDVDPRTACFVRFYHEHFQQHKPHLLHQIKRATKSDQQSKDELESVKQDVLKLQTLLVQMRDDTDRRLAEMSYDCNRRITNMKTEFETLTALVHSRLGLPVVGGVVGQPAVHSHLLAPANGSLHGHLTATVPPLPPVPPAAAAAVPAAPVPSTLSAQPAVPPTLPPAAPVVAPWNTTSSPGNPMTAEAIAAANAMAAGTTRTAPGPDLMQSLSEAAAISLQQQQQQQQQQAAAAGADAAMNVNASTNTKRPAQGEAAGAPPLSVPKS